MGDNRVPNGRNGIRVDHCLRIMPLRDAANGAIAPSNSRADASVSPGAGSVAWFVARAIAAAITSCACLFAANAAGDNGATRERTAVTLPDGEAWPGRTIRLVVPQAPGGTADVVARMLGDRLESALGVPVVVDNRPGANGVIGTEFARRAAPDGYTLLLASTATHAMAPHTSLAATFDPLADFVPIANLAWQTKVVLVSTALPVASVSEFVAYARQRPGALNYASTGFGSSSHLDTELLAAATGIALHHVPYRGSGQTVAAISTDEVQVLIASLTAAQGAIESGRARPLAVLSARRSTLVPDVPTIAEAGIPSLDVRTWLGLVAPAGTPGAIVDELDRLVGRMLAAPAVRSWFDVQGLEPASGTPSSFEALIRADVAKWGDVARRLEIRPK
ncbi:MAG: tripartite tricarboxylate transporter substrate binding protein [Betaproteobacteria bacterium]|nr:tripartite tricarboxylate transporter substrate binding protein [Betaproteobacteria bacterium]